ncbi:MAG TPA: DUF4349 domain-containing protein, partial [Pyrinomonadaceae bacterium]|nr:DUF4349 domain-containing protein [Pyrinomonadaceae bacterium]
MKSLAILLLCLGLLISGCDFQSAKPERDRMSVAQSPVEVKSDVNQLQATEPVKMQPVSLSDADKSLSISETIERKIIRDANISLEVPSTTETQHKVTAIAEQHGGFVVTSEAKQRDNVDLAKRTLDIKLVVRVPANQFGPTLNEIKGLASNVTQ